MCSFLHITKAIKALTCQNFKFNFSLNFSIPLYSFCILDLKSILLKATVITSDFEFSIDSLSVDLGNLNELNTWTATGTSILTATTSYPDGYTIRAYADYNGELRLYDGQTLVDYIQRWPYSNSNPQLWSGTCEDNSECGFGYTTDSLLGPNCDDNRFATSTKYAGFATSSQLMDEVGKSCTEAFGDQTQIKYKVSTSKMKTPGDYQGTIYYVASVNY